MTEYKQVTDFPSDEMVIRRIVRAIQKAIEEDVPEFCRENYMETMNSVRYVRGDKINDNLRALVVSDDVILISFKRYSWDSRMLVDLKNRISYTVTTQQNLIACWKRTIRKLWRVSLIPIPGITITLWHTLLKRISSSVWIWSFLIKALTG